MEEWYLGCNERKRSSSKYSDSLCRNVTGCFLDYQNAKLFEEYNDISDQIAPVRRLI